MLHTQSHPFAGRTIKIKPEITHPQYKKFGGEDFRLEDWWDKVYGKSWMDSDGNPAALIYALRSGMGGLPIDDDVVYGKVGSFGSLLHISELEFVDE